MSQQGSESAVTGIRGRVANTLAVETILDAASFWLKR